MNQEDFHLSLCYMEELPVLFNNMSDLAEKYECSLDTIYIFKDFPLQIIPQNYQNHGEWQPGQLQCTGRFIKPELPVCITGNLAGIE